MTEVKYNREFYNKLDENEQWIRLSDGCYRNCEFCYCPQDKLSYELPEIERNLVKIMDMNFLYAYPDPIKTLYKLGSKKVNGKVVNYELICGIDWRLLNLAVAGALKENRFKNIRLAWDNKLQEQKEIKKAIDRLLKVGYRSNDISVFMITNWKISYEDCIKKLDLCKIWRVKVNECWYDNQLSPNIKPIHWTESEIKIFRRKVRKHNQIVNFGIDPELKD